MPLETGTYISDLNAANPTATDGLNQGDDHLRLLKSTVKQTFPNVAGAVTPTHTDLNTAVTKVVTDGVDKLADGGVNFKTNTGDGFSNPVAGEIDVKCGGAVVAKFKSDGSFQPTGNLTAPGSVPIGGSMPWFEDTLPDASYGTYAWLNGQAISRTTFAALFARFGTTYGAGDGSTTFNLPNLQEVSLYGKSTMGGASSPGRITNYVMTALGTIIGACTHLLTTGEMPAHSHTATVTDPTHSHTVTAATQSGATFAAGGSPTGAVNGTLTTSSAATGISVSNANTGGGGAHDNVSPGMAVNWVMRIA